MTYWFQFGNLGNRQRWTELVFSASALRSKNREHLGDGSTSGWLAPGQRRGGEGGGALPPNNGSGSTRMSCF